MSAQDILKKLRPSGFLKIAGSTPATMKKEQRAALIRKGNELFNKGDLKLAQRIFLTTKYSDGLIRIGDRYVQEGKPIAALHLYWVAPAPEKAAVLVERFAKVMQEWLHEEKKAGTA